MAIAFLDVDYKKTGARAACVLAESWFDASPVSVHSTDLRAVEAYEPGQFYRRELPCLLAVLRALSDHPDIVVVDGYVWLGSEARPGLGFYLYEALGAKIPVVGIAKTAYAGVESSSCVATVFRGESKGPLFVTCVGTNLGPIAERVREMAGLHRIPSYWLRSTAWQDRMPLVRIGLISPK